MQTGGRKIHLAIWRVNAFHVNHTHKQLVENLENYISYPPHRNPGPATGIVTL